MARPTQTAREFEVLKHSRGRRVACLLHLPRGYEKAERKWPLMLFLHGSGERGSNPRKVAVHGPPKLARHDPGFPFVLLSPQCPAGETWDDAVLLELLDQVIGGFRVDDRQVYLTGISMGGYGAWSLGLKHPERFAALAPVCGGGSMLPILLPGRGKEAALRKLPVWAFHGGRDDLVPVEESERMIRFLRNMGNEAKLTVFPEAGHDSWTEAYNDPELFAWMLRHRLRPRKNRKV